MDATTILDIGSKSLKEQVYIIWLSKLLNNIKDLKELTNVNLKDLHDIIQNKDKILMVWYENYTITNLKYWDNIDKILLKCLERYKVQNINELFSKIIEVANYLGLRLKASSYYIRENVWSQIIAILKTKLNEKECGYFCTNLNENGRCSSIKVNDSGHRSINKILTKDDSATLIDFPSLKTIDLNPEPYEESKIKHESTKNNCKDHIKVEVQDNIPNKRIKTEPVFKEEPPEYDNINIKLENFFKGESHDIIPHQEIKSEPVLNSCESSHYYEDEMPKECEEFISIKEEETAESFPEIETEPITILDIESDSDEEDEIVIELEIISDEGEVSDSNNSGTNENILKELENIIENSKKQMKSNDFKDIENSKGLMKSSNESPQDNVSSSS